MLGYFASNCGTCHNRSGETSFTGPSLKHGDVADGDAVAKACSGYATRWQVPGAARRRQPHAERRRHDASAMLARMRSRRPSSQMPPLGTILRDDKAIDAIAKWIATDLAKR